MSAREVIALRFVHYTKYDLLGKSGNELADMVLDALDAAGFAIVPKLPTEAMQDAFYADDDLMFDDCYRAMLKAAAPTLSGEDSNE